ncbi:hypothetical protein TRICHSKD4_2274 [Roseibium sp. TrichSKD4]|uniref:hypothetical protein n=1 Tax=Roseibium sp. TrichSKD4 TaxID=744980 RepID=UPI0001E5693B|nr:hypothetical protein [Roseibium sp. TrichSKD4]EFO32475.1 hypothetical protein TRICHSKD4_2274 [Roseibium sp. TrichSKD4]
MSGSSLFHTEDMADIAAICGDDVALELLEKLPGVEVKIPTQWTEDNPLSRLSRETAETLIATFPGDKFYIPTKKGRASIATAKRMKKEGFKNCDIAFELHVSERYVRDLVREGRGGRRARARVVDDRQIDLEDLLNRSEG